MKPPVSPVTTAIVAASLTLMMQAAAAEGRSNCVAAPEYYPMHHFPMYQGQMIRPGLPEFVRPEFPARPEFSRPDWVVEIEKGSAQRRTQPFQAPAMPGFERPEFRARPEFSRPDWVVEIEKGSAQRRTQPFQSPAMPGFERPEFRARPEFSRPDWVVEIEKGSAQRRTQPFQSPAMPGYGRPGWVGNQLPGRPQMGQLPTPLLHGPAGYPAAPGWLNRGGPWSGVSDWGPMEGLMDGTADGNWGMTFNGRSDLAGRGFGYGRGYDSWWDLPPAPPIAPVVQDAAPVVEEVVAEAPAEIVAVDVDADKDGVVNEMDFCLETPAGTEVDSFGCSKQAAIVLRGVNFHTDSDQLTDSSTTILDKVVKTLVAHPELKVEVAGHTDSDGEDTYNKDLSQRRATTVVNYLVTNQVKPENLTAKGYGEAMPMADNDTPEGKALNRRVELNRLD